MKTTSLARFLVLTCAWQLCIWEATASTVAFWRFEEGPSDAQVTHGGEAAGVFYPGIGDSSWYGNALSVWAEGWAGYAFRTDVPASSLPGTGEANNFSVQNTGSYPAMFTQNGTWLQGMTPQAFTIEVSFKPETGGWRTLVGRDSRGTYASDTDLAALYLQITPQNAVAIKFCDVSGYWHEAISFDGLITGFTPPDSASSQWYNLAAVSDGFTLSLYLDSGFGHILVAQTDLTFSGSPNTALTAGAGSGSDWSAGNWTVGRGLYAGGHADRAYGFIDEVRISDHAFYWSSEFLFPLFKHPQSQTVVVGSDVTFSVTPINSGAVNYQWQSNSVSIPGAISASYTALNVQLADDGTSFRAIVSNAGGSITSAPAILTVRIPQTRVVTTSNDNGPGSLRQTVAEALIGDTITFSNTLSGATIMLTSGELLLDENLTIDASALTNGIILNGNASGRIFEVASGRTVVLDSLTITNGKVINEGGGGVRNSEGNVTLNRCTVTGSSGNYGGGIENYYGPMTLNQCTLTKNSAVISSGGAIDNYGTLAVNQSTISGNFGVSSGGGIRNYGSMTLNNSIVAGNTAPTYTNIVGPVSLTGNNLTAGAPLLAPLGNYGGPTPTMPPLPGSPAVDGCTSGTSFVTDQRGLSRIVGSFADIGAVESGNPCITVNTAWDENDGIGINGISLREAVAYAPAGSTILFAPALSGATIRLTNSQIALNRSLTIDAAGLPGGIAINGNHASRIFQIGIGVPAALNSLTITNGIDTGGGNAGGGGILNYGTLTLNNCTVAANAANQSIWGGGGILSYNGTLTVNQSTISGNSANNGTYGGAMIIYNGALTINQSTVSGNSAIIGGGIYNSGGTIALNNSIVAGNTASSSPNIAGPASLTGNNLTTGTPFLAPLGNYGGPAPTMPPLCGSPAIDGCASGTSFTTDQRGLSRIVGSFADIGAVEAGNAIPFLLVNTAADENNGPWTNGVSLREAIAYAPSGSPILFAPGLFGATILLTNGQLNISSCLNIVGPGAEALTISGNQATRVFNVTATNVTLSGLTIADAASALDGAAVNAGGSSGSTLLITDCILTNNSTTGSGGALFNNAGVVTSINRTLIAANHANASGGGAFNAGGTLKIDASTWNNNSAAYGGGIYNHGAYAGGATITIASSTFSGNTAAQGGGGISNDGAWLGSSSTLKINASTFSGNAPGGIYTDGRFGGSAAFELGDTILNAGASGGNIVNFDGAGTITSRGYNLCSDNGGGFLNAAGDQIDTDPLLGSLQNNGGPTLTHALLLGSPALDSGKRDAITNMVCTVDQRGVARLVDFAGMPNAAGGDGSDIGAFEFQGTSGYDTDADGLPDVWELAFFPNLSQSNTSDSDGDGQNNAQEYLADTCPVNADDCFRILSFARSGTSNTVWWTSKSTRRYELERSASLTGPMTWETFMTNSAPGWNNAGFDEAGSQYFYRVRVVVP